MHWKILDFVMQKAKDEEQAKLHISNRRSEPRVPLMFPIEVSGFERGGKIFYRAHFLFRCGRNELRFPLAGRNLRGVRGGHSLVSLAELQRHGIHAGAVPGCKAGGSSRRPRDRRGSPPASTQSLTFLLRRSGAAGSTVRRLLAGGRRINRVVQQ